ncbi:MAG: type I-C CRISPR-associated protein Cas8c/Csd1 [Deltaproteobacteria bacterium]|uniref:type I-C CRISPR-associated protein Cas8c/Csd1 n=1 Tax=Desulfobacula sp. TaxID=2593537 RepID=UPI0019936748|nr:type I-C CRISPR-associated protein Cas8c/Csd1 [Candidatus Desulfobacula maris]MBL6995238.1 type I-C CRISPR-associated protein Cas8c/Csd1 [Desulfobacula sp.]
MILQALKSYYDRKSLDPESGIPPEGFEIKPIPFLIVIDRNGKFINLEDTREPVGKKLIPRSFLVPRSKPRSAKLSYKTTFFLWDHIGYVLEHSNAPKDDAKAKNQHETWLKSLKEIPPELSSQENISAIQKFYDSGGIKDVKSHITWDECKKGPYCNITFKMAGEELPIPCGQAVQDYIKQELKHPGDESNHSVKGLVKSRCLVTGEIDEIVRVHNDTRIGKDAKKLVSFQRNYGFDSFGKEYAFNAPIGKTAEFAYVTALNTLLKSKSRMLVGDAVTVFWSEKDSDLENQIAAFFREPPKDDPDRGVEAVKGLYNSVKSGVFHIQTDNRFYVLGLAPNTARISVRFWISGTVAGIAEKIYQHFKDTQIIVPQKHRDDWPQWQSLNALLSATANNTKFDANKSNLVYYRGKYFDVKPNIGGETIRCILEGLPYPHTLFQAAIRRIHAEHDIPYPRAALIKAWINRSTRFKNPQIKEELTMSLDENNTNIGYRLGRLFATLEKIQQEANPGINATIRDRFYAAASGTPSTVFGNLMRLKNHHLAKMDRVGRKIFFEKLLGQIIDGVAAEISFPAHLSLEDQGRFAIGYYHQMQKFFTKNV